MPINGERDGRVAQHAEVEAVVGVLPDIFAAQNEVPANRLLQPGVELVAESRRQRCRHARDQALDHGIIAALARKHEILVEWRLKRARIRGAKHCVGRLYVITEADARLRLPGYGEPVVKIAANANIELPVARRNRVLDIKCQFLHVSAPAEIENRGRRYWPCQIVWSQQRVINWKIG